MQWLVDGLLLGGLYTSVAVGFSLVWGVTKIVNTAHAGFIMIGSYITYWLFELYGIDPFLSIPVSMAVLFVVGYVVQLVLINRLVQKDLLRTIILTYGILLVLVNFVLVVWSPNHRAVQPDYAGAGLSILGVRLPLIRVLILSISVATVGGLHLFLTRTRRGQAIQAVSQNQVAAQLMGINLRRTYCFTTGLAAALGGLTGALISTTQTISPSMTEALLLTMFVVVILGGFGSIVGVVVAGFILGVTENFAGVMLGTQYQSLVPFTLFVLILLVRPRGLMGKQFF